MRGQIANRVCTIGATTKSGAAAIPDQSYFEAYHSWEEHGQFLEDLSGAFADNSETFVAGQSLEGRDMRGIHLYGSGGPGKTAIVWHGNVHAREWITSMVCSDIIVPWHWQLLLTQI